MNVSSGDTSKSPQMGMGRKPMDELNSYLTLPLCSKGLQMSAGRSAISINIKNKHYPLSGSATEGD